MRESKELRASAILTTSNVESEVMKIDNYNQVELMLDFTKGSLTNILFFVEFKMNDVWYQECSSAVSGGTSTDTLLVHTITATGKYRLVVPTGASEIRVTVKGTGTATNSLLAIIANKAQV